MIEARSTRGITLQLGEAPQGTIEPAQKASTDRARSRLEATDNSVRFPREGSRSNRPDLLDNWLTLRIPTRSQPSPATSRRRKEGWVRQKQLQSRQMQSAGQPGQCRIRLRLCGGRTRTSRIHRAAS